MDNRSDAGLSRAILIVGLANAIALIVGFMMLTKTVQHKEFAFPNPGNPPATMTVSQSGIVNLPNGRFVVADRDRILVMRVDEKNQITTLSSAHIAD